MKSHETTLDAETLLSHAPWLRRLAASLVGKEDAEDVVQQTWLQALRNPPSGEGGLRGFLATTARHIAWRTREREAHRSDRERRAARDEAIPSTEDALDQLHLQRLVVDAVLTLPEPQRDVVLLRYFHGIEPSRIAERLSIPASTVRSTLSRSLVRLRQHLDRHWEGSSAWRLAILPLATLRPPVAKTAWFPRLLRPALLLTFLGATTLWLLDLPDEGEIIGGGVWNERSMPAADAEFARLERTPKEPTASARSSEVEPPAKAFEVDGVLARSVAVFVTHEDGAPAAHVPVLLEVFENTSWKSCAWSRSDAAGLARFENELADLSARDRSRRLRVVPGIHARTPRTVEFHARDLSDEPLKLVLPPLGRVSLLLADDELPEGGTAILANLAPSDEEATPHGRRVGLLFRGHASARLGLPVPEGRGRFVFPHVELGIELRLELSSYEPRVVVFEGPRARNEDVRVTVEELPEFIRARLLDSSGRPLRDEAVVIEFGEVNPVEEHGLRFAARTDAQGDLHVLLPLRSDPRLAYWMIVERSSHALEDSLRGVESAYLEWRAGTALERDLGTLTLQESPLLLAGAVMDLEGRPLADVTVQGMRERRLPDGPQPLPHRIPLPYRAKTDAHGAFELRGHAPRDTFVWVRANDDRGNIARTPPVVAGSSGLLLTLGRSAFLRGRARLDAFVPVENVAVSIEHAGWTLDGDHLRRDGSFSVGPLSGPIDHVTFSLGNMELARFPLSPGQELVAPFDLRGCLKPLELKVEDERGTPIVGEELFLRRRADREALVSNGTKAEGHVRFLAPVDESEFVITSRGYRACAVDYHAGVQTVRLAPAAVLHLSCTGPLPAPPERFVVRATLLADGSRDVDSVAPGGMREAPLSDDGEARVPLSLEGTWRVRLVWVKPRAFGRPLEVPLDHEPLRLQVRDGSPFDRRLVLDRSAIETARQRFY